MDLTPPPAAFAPVQITRHEYPDRIEYRLDGVPKADKLRKLLATKELVPVFLPEEEAPKMLRLQRRALAYPTGTAYEFFFLMNYRGAPVTVNVEHVRIHLKKGL